MSYNVVLENSEEPGKGLRGRISFPSKEDFQRWLETKKFNGREVIVQGVSGEEAKRLCVDHNEKMK